jgi:hypothetical protein
MSLVGQKGEVEAWYKILCLAYEKHIYEIFKEWQ